MALDLLEKNARLVKMEEENDTDDAIGSEEKTEDLDDKDGGEEEM